MQCYTDLIPPTGVTHALSLSFVSANATNLVVAKTSLLQVFQTKNSDQGNDTKLILIAEYTLSGTVTALSRVQVQNTRSGGEAVLIAFKDAKLSLVEWDPAFHSISTISIHYYENHAAQAAPWTPDPNHCVTHLTADPNSRCAAFNFAVSNLAVIPFHHAGDDLAMDDLESLNGSDEVDGQAMQTNGDAAGHDRPYFPSFVLPLTALDPNLLHPVAMAFLHEYRNPTIGMLYSTTARSSNMLAERRDVMIYSVYAFEIDQRASTTLQSIHNLPNDVNKVHPLPAPVGGALLIGGNELIHVAEGGKATAVAVNEFARDSSSFPMSDSATLAMRLEGCHIVSIDGAGTDVLIILESGELAVLSFKMEGRNVSTMAIRRIEADNIQDLLRGPSSCIVSLGSGCIFVGNEESDSLLLNTSKRGPLLKRQPSRAQVQTNGHATNGMEDEDMDGEDDDDDIFNTDLAPAGGHAVAGDGSSLTGYNIRMTDRLPAISPLRDSVIGRSRKRKRDEDQGDVVANADESLKLAVAYGRGRAGGVAFVSPHLEPSTNVDLGRVDAEDLWCFQTEDQSAHGEPAQFHVILSSKSENGLSSSTLWTVDADGINKKEDTEFESSTGRTIAVETLMRSSHTIHVTETDIRSYDSNFGLSQIVPVVDEDEGNNAKVVKASLAEPFLLLLKDDSTVTLYKADSTGELEELDLPEPLGSSSIVAASFYLDSTDFFDTSRFHRSSQKGANLLLLLLTQDGTLILLPMANPKMRVFELEGMSFVPLLLAADMPLPKHWRQKETISDILMTHLGDEADQQPYIIVQTATGDLVIYAPFALPEVTGSFRLRKVAFRNAEFNGALFGDDGEMAVRLPPLRIVNSIGSFAAVYVPGPSPRLILKHASTMPHVYALGGMRSLAGLPQPTLDSDLLYINGDSDLCFGQLPQTSIIGLSDWMINKVDLYQDVSALTCFPDTQSYVLATNYETKFQLPQDDEWHSEWQNERTTFLPTTTQSTLKLMSAQTYHILSQHHFEANERILCVKTMNLEVSEKTHERKDLIVVGTAITKGENVVTRGNIYLFDVVDVVPYPDRPESNLKLKLLTREDVRGAVTSISSIGSQGFLLAAQGQKCMVRGLREDKSILPVAFMDMRYYVHVAKELASTGLTILGDAYSGLWLMGYSEEPYKMQLLGRDFDNPNVAAAEFLPSGKELYILSLDLDGQLRILQYDPENPKSERGSKLLLRSTFDTGSIPLMMSLIPRTPTSYEAASSASNPGSSNDSDAMVVDSMSTPQHQILVLSQTGALSLVTALSEAAYRRLSALQNIMLNQVEHACSLNPRAYRAVETDGMGGRGVVDGNLVRRWGDLSSAQKANFADKVGAKGVWEVTGDLESIQGGFGFLS